MISTNARPMPERPFVLLLGLLWLGDGLLQLQPKLFGQDLIDNVLAPNREGQPAFMAHVVNVGIRVCERNLVVANTAAAGIELVIGTLLLAPVGPRWRRLALWASIAWALLVWVFGEAAGNLLTGSASFFTGAPGAALLYLILTVFLLFPLALPLTRLPLVVGMMFLLGAALNAFPTFWRADGQSTLWDASRTDSRGFMAFPGKELARVAPTAVTTNLATLVVLVLLGALLLIKPSRPLGVITLVVLALVWWVSQDLGGVLTFPHGVATDPNSAPLLMLMALPLMIGARGEARRPSGLLTLSLD